MPSKTVPLPVAVEPYNVYPCVVVEILIGPLTSNRAAEVPVPVGAAPSPKLLDVLIDKPVAETSELL